MISIQQMCKDYCTTQITIMITIQQMQSLLTTNVMIKSTNVMITIQQM